MKLLNLNLHNFKGVRNLDFEPSGADAEIHGDNGTGKSTVADAYLWLLFGKDSLGRSDFEVKTLDKDGQPFHNLEHSVSAEFDLSGERLSLKKTYKEVWTQKRGSAAKEFGGHTTDYLVNGVPIQKKEYDARVSGICTEKRFRTLSDPMYFNSLLPWQERRAILLQVCGDCTDLEVLESSPALVELGTLLGSKTLDEYRKVLGAERKKLNDELATVPVRIDEARRTIVEARHVAKGEAESIQAAIRSLQEKRAQASSGGIVAELTAKLRTVEAEAIDIANRIRSQGNPDRDKAMAEQARLKRVLANAELSAKDIEARIAAGEATISRLDGQLSGLRDRYKQEAAKVCSANDVCPACLQPLPEEKVQAAREEFNGQKARKLADIQAEGKALRTDRDAKAAKIEEWRSEWTGFLTEASSLRSSIDGLFIPDAESLSPESDDGYQAKRQAAREVEAKIDDAKDKVSDVLRDIDAELEDAQDRLRETQEAAAAAVRSEESRKRVDELTTREGDLAKAFEETERRLFLCDEFVRARVRLLDERVNAKFDLVRFKLFDEQVNGGLSECCVATVGGVPFDSGLNHGACLNAGLETIDVLARHLSFAPPIFVDNAEAVTAIRPTIGQQIRLVVSAADPTLRIETRSASRKTQEALL